MNHLAFSPDGRRFASASFDKKVKVWDGRTGTFLATLNGHVGAVYQVAWSADSRLLVSASKDSTVKLWEMVALKRCVTFKYPRVREKINLKKVPSKAVMFYYIIFVFYVTSDFDHTHALPFSASDDSHFH